MNDTAAVLRQALFGRPLATYEAAHQRLTKRKALAVFSSDALSSTAYATEAILLVLIAAGTGHLGVSMGIAIGIALLLVIVAISYYQTIHAYPNGGGAYIVSKDNLGSGAGLVAAAALLIDYILTVSVSVSAGVAALTSAVPESDPYRIEIALAIVVFITLMNMRGVKESGTFFAIPTYAFIIGIFTMLGIGIFRVIMGDVSPVAPPDPHILQENITHGSGLTLFLILRAFAGGCTALTGVEAISNGIPAFKKPESDNAGKTLIVMVMLLSTMFLGITFLAHQYEVIAVHEAESTVVSQIARAVFGGENVLFYYLQFSTLFILSLAANTAFADFPRLASLIAQDRYLPRQLTSLGDRLVFSNGIISLAVLASVLIVIFGAKEHNLLPLYAVGVFLSFTLSQSGMVIHWLKERHQPNFKPDFVWRFRIGLNAFGAVCTGIVLVILAVTKFHEGAWIVVALIPMVVYFFTRIHKHYETVAQSLSLDGLEPCKLRDLYPDQTHVPVIVLANSLNRCSLQAIEYATRVSDNVRVCAIEIDPSYTQKLRDKWREWDIKIPLDVVTSPYRSIADPLLEYLHERDMENANQQVTVVVMPEFVVTHWWERFLHNQTSGTIRDALYHDQITRGRGRPVINVPYRIGEELYEPLSVDTKASVEGKLSSIRSQAKPSGAD